MSEDDDSLGIARALHEFSGASASRPISLNGASLIFSDRGSNQHHYQQQQQQQQQQITTSPTASYLVPMDPRSVVGTSNIVVGVDQDLIHQDFINDECKTI